MSVCRDTQWLCTFISPTRKDRTNTDGSHRSKVIIYQDRHDQKYEQHPSGIQANFRQLFVWKHHLQESSLVMCEIWQKLNFYNFTFIFILAWLPTFDMAPVVCVDLTGFGLVVEIPVELDLWAPIRTTDYKQHHCVASHALMDPILWKPQVGACRIG